MFEEICLMCGKHLQDDGRAYCSDNCENNDLNSPSVSSSSSALSSPQLGYAGGGDVPALVPSALGSALKTYQGRDFYDVSSSSASSTSWSVVTDDDENDTGLGEGGEYSYHGSTDSFHEGGSKSANFVYSIHPSGLSYTRRPSGTNNRSTVPHLHRRLFSDSSSSHAHSIPRSPLLHSSRSSSDDEENFSDSGFLPQGLDHDWDDMYSEKGWIDAKSKSNPARSQNRSSLPSYFSLLQILSPSKEIKLSPISSFSGNTIARPSPPTPKATLGSALALRTAGSAPMPSLLATPRGRRRSPEKSRSSRRSGRSSRSSSRSRARHAIAGSPILISHSRLIREEHAVDCAVAHPLPRGREAARRNSSPAKMHLGLEDSVRALVAMRDADIIERSKSGNRTQPKMRGRARVEELDGVGSFAGAPGYGNGRSGLVSRERVASHSMRVPL